MSQRHVEPLMRFLSLQKLYEKTFFQYQMHHNTHNPKSERQWEVIKVKDLKGWLYGFVDSAVVPLGEAFQELGSRDHSEDERCTRELGG